LIDLVHQSELPCCWLALDQLDRDPQRFIACLIAALAERYPDFGKQTQTMLSEMKSFDADIERLAVSLANELFNQIQEHFILIVDDFHLVEDVLPIQRFINRLLQLVDENSHLILSSRILSSLPELTLMVAREQVAGLSFSDLAFRMDEIQSLLEQNEHVRISDEEARHLFEETEGWITGLQFSGAAVFRESRGMVQLNTGFHLFDYLGQQVLDRQSKSVQEFLLRTSMMEEFDAGLCREVLSPFYRDPQDWNQWIRIVVQKNLFALPVGTDGSWLRYHHLFSDFLQDRYRREYPQEVEPLLRRIGDAYENLGEWSKAHHIYKQLGDATVLAEMIERAGPTMVSNAHLTLASWLNDLPPSVLQIRPGLVSIRGVMADFNDDLRGALDLLNQAEREFRTSEDRTNLGLTLARRASTYRRLGDYPASLKDAEEAIGLTEKDESLENIYAQALRFKGLAHFRMGQLRQAVQSLEASLNQYTRLNLQPNIAMLHTETGAAYLAMGRLKETETAFESALGIWRAEKNMYRQANVLNNIGLFWHGLGEYEKAGETYEEGFLCAQQSDHPRLEALISIGLGDLYSETEDFALAATHYQHAESMLGNLEEKFLLHFLALGEVNLALVQDHLEQARGLVEDIAPSIRSGNSGYENALLDMLCGRIFLCGKVPQQAVQAFQEAVVYFDEDDRTAELDSSRVWLAAAHHQAGDIEAVRQILKTLLNKKKEQLPHAMLLAGHLARRWLEGIQKDEQIGQTVREWLVLANRFADLLPEVRRRMRLTARVGSPPSPSLKIKALGHSEVYVDDKPLTLADWRTQSVRDLFFYYLVHAKPLAKEKVAADLWPDLGDPARIKLRFKNEVYRLRRAVGHEVITFTNELYAFNRALDYEYDVEAFTAYISKARSALSPGEQIDFYQKAVDLVRGRFLEDIGAEWVALEREHLQQAFLSALLKLAELCLQAARFEQGLAACSRALREDAALEPAYALSMQFHHRLGNRAAVIKTYEAAKENLRGGAEVSLSPETEEVYKRLVA